MGKIHTRIMEHGGSLRLATALAAIVVASLLALRAGDAVFGQAPVTDAVGATTDAVKTQLTDQNALHRAGRALKDLAARITTASSTSAVDQGATTNIATDDSNAPSANGRLSTTDAKEISHATVSAWSAIWNSIRPLFAALWRPFTEAWSRLLKAWSGDTAGAGISVKFSTEPATADATR